MIPADKPSATSRKPSPRPTPEGAEVVDKNIAAVDATLENLHRVDTTGKPSPAMPFRPSCPQTLRTTSRTSSAR
ncbi:MAG: hypothetical protein ACLT8E_06760 [Akkermansia sp.]